MYFAAVSHSPSGMALPAPYYQPEEDDERPFICSLGPDNGIMSCVDVPARREGGHSCCLDKEDALHRQVSPVGGIHVSARGPWRSLLCCLGGHVCQNSIFATDKENELTIIFPETHRALFSLS